MSDPFDSLINPADSLERQNAKLRVIVQKLMARVEHVSQDRTAGYYHFERAIALEDQVRHRTHDLQEALDILNATNAQLASAQRETEKARRNLTNAVEAIQEGFAIFDAHENLVLKNKQFAALLPDIQDRIVTGMNFETYVNLCVSSAHLLLPDGMSPAQWVDQRLRAHQDKSVHFTVALRDHLWMQVSEQRTDDGGTIILQTDMTDLMRLEHEERTRMLDEQGQIVKDTLDHIEQGILIFDAQGRLAEWNDPATHFLHIPPRFLKKGTRRARFDVVFDPGRVFHAASNPRRIYDWLCQGQGRETFRAEMSSRHGAQLEVFGQEMRDGSCVLSFTDITTLRRAHRELREANAQMEQRVRDRTEELRAARDEAQRANASKSRFVAAASHDLLQPVNAAKLFISSLQHSELSQKQSTTVDRISASFQSVETILGALLDISKLDSGKAVLNVSDLELGPIFERLRDEFTPIALQKGLELRIVPTSVCVQSDPVYLRRILQNLVSNAIRYTDRGRVLIGVRRRGDGVRVCVLDTGIGLARDQQKAIFQEFHRVDPKQQSNTAMGLGLAIVERACAMLEHRLELQSQLGQGTQFHIDLPYAQQPVAASERMPYAGDGPALMQNAMIMVIENDPNVRDAMERMLETWGATPIIAQDHSDAEAQIDALGLVPDVFLVDYHLDNGADGLSVIGALRAKYGPLRAILLTADRDQRLQAEATALGVFLRYKPVDIEDLNRLVSGLLRDVTATP